MLNLHGKVAEASVANVFARIDGTPDADVTVTLPQSESRAFLGLICTADGRARSRRSR